jgi:hypothetical protein
LIFLPVLYQTLLILRIIERDMIEAYIGWTDIPTKLIFVFRNFANTFHSQSLMVNTSIIAVIDIVLQNVLKKHTIVTCYIYTDQLNVTKSS